MKVNLNSNNVNFQGKVIPNNLLDNAIDSATIKDLKRFNKLLGKISRIDDSWTYTLNLKEKMLEQSKIQKLQLNSNNFFGIRGDRTIAEAEINCTLENCDFINYKNSLKKLTSIIKNDYKKSKYELKLEQLKKEIYNSLKNESS